MSRTSVLAGLSLLLTPVAVPPSAPASDERAAEVVASLYRWNAPPSISADGPMCWNCYSRVAFGYANHQFDWSQVFIGFECDGPGCHMFWTGGLCEWEHSQCMVYGSEWLGKPEGMDRVEQVVAQGDVGLLRELLESTGSVEVNEERGALQVRNCTGEVIGHFPLRHTVLALLTE